MYLAFGVAIALALGVVSWRRASGAVARSKRLKAPGFNPERPLTVAGYGEVDTFADRVRCPHCGKGRLTVLGEGNMTGSSGQLVALKTECLRCEHRVTVFFDVSEVPN